MRTPTPNMISDHNIIKHNDEIAKFILRVMSLLLFWLEIQTLMVKTVQVASLACQISVVTPIIYIVPSPPLQRGTFGLQPQS